MPVHRLQDLIHSNLSIKLISLILSFIFLVVLSMSFYTQQTEKEVLSEQIDEYGYSLAKAMAIFAVEPMLIRDYPVLDTFVVNMVQDNRDVIQIKIFRDDGKIVSQASVVDINTLLKYQRIYRSKIKIHDSLKNNTLKNNTLENNTLKNNTLENNTLENSTLVNNRSKSIGQIQLTLSTQRADNFISSRLWNLTQISLVSILFLVVFMMMIINRTLTIPLSKLTRSAQTLSDGDLSQNIGFKGNDELAVLAETLESMRKNLNTFSRKITQQNKELKLLDRSKDAFLARVSHEINTPLNGF